MMLAREEEETIQFDGMAPEAIKDAILRYVVEISKLESDKKEFNTGTRDTIKDLKRRIKLALEALEK